MPATPTSPSGPEATRAALIDAGLDLFGRLGFAATSTRAVAKAAGANVAAISYHFGSKEGLHAACGAEVARRLGATAARIPDTDPPTPSAAAQVLESAVRLMAGFLLSDPAARPVLPFMLRTINEGGPVLDAIYDTLFDPLHRRICRLWGIATGRDPESEAVRVAVFSMLGQALYFRIGERVVLRRLDWPAYTPETAALVTETLVGNLRAALAAQAVERED